MSAYDYGEILSIGGEKQLLIDDRIVEDTWCVPRVVHQGERHAGNPIMVGDQQWDENRMFFPEVRRRDDGLWEMWYVGHKFELRENGTGVDGNYRIGYATSKDGVEWTKPELNVASYRGTVQKNLIINNEHVNDRGECIASHHGPQGLFLIDGVGPANDDGLLHAVTKAKAPDIDDPLQKGGVCHIVSPDGIRWYRSPKRFMLITGHSDCTNHIVWNEQLKRYLCYMRPPVFAGPAKRRIAISQSKDLVEWTQPIVAVTTDELDPPARDIDRCRVFRYEGVWLCFMTTYDHDERGDAMEVELLSSYDGVEWHRLGVREPILARGQVGAFDEDQVAITTGPFLMNGRLYAYYDGQSGVRQASRPQGESSAIGLASWRLDGFISRHHQPIGNYPARAGEILTRSLRCEGGSLHINANSKSTGSVAVEVMEVDPASGDHLTSSKVAVGYARENCVAFVGDEVDAHVRWKHSDSLDSLRGKVIRLKFYLDSAEIFAFQLRRQ